MTTLKRFGAGAPGSLRISLADANADVAGSLVYAFADAPDVEVLHGNLLDLACDAVVSPANSFGDMGGGIDKAIDEFHRRTAQPAVAEAIRKEFLGELPVGCSLIVRLNSRRMGYVVVAPTMRIPGRITGTINAYLAMRAALVAVVRNNETRPEQIASLAVPGLGTGVGGLGYEEAAEQMRNAYDVVIGGRWRQIVHPALAPYPLAR